MTPRSRTLARCLLATSLLSGALTAAQAGPIALRVTVRNTPGCPADTALGFTVEGVRELAAGALRKKGYQVVADPREAPGGLEALIQVDYCQNFRSGDSVAYAAAVGMHGVSNGSSAVSAGTRVAFNYGHSMISYGGTSGGTEARMRDTLATTVRNFIASTF